MTDRIKYILWAILVLLSIPLWRWLWQDRTPGPAAPPALVEMDFFDRTETAVCALPGLDLAELPQEAVVYVAGGRGGQKLGWPIDRISGHEGNLVKVAVNSPERPVLLMLGAYEPTIWRIEWTEGTRILGAMMSGYHSQFVSGLPPKTPLLISGYDQKHPCGYFNVDGRSGQKTGQYARLSQTLFGRDPEAVMAAEKGLLNIGPVDGRPLVSAGPWRPEDFKLTGALPGEFGLNQAVADGLLRPALVRDMHQWRLARAAREKAAALAGGLPERLIPPPPEMRGSGDQPFRRVYVVLSPDFVLPNGLYGGNSVSFLLPPGVPMPRGDMGHNQFRFMEDGRSLGPHPD